MNALGVKDIRLVVPPGFPVSMLPDIPTVTAPDHARGIAHSLRAGLTAQGEESAAVLIFLADMPFPPPPALIGQMVSQLPNFGSVRPTWQGKPGHPVLVSRSLWPAIIEMDGDRGAQAVLDRGTSVHVESVDDGVIFDIDRPADLREARRRLQKLRDAGG